MNAEIGAGDWVVAVRGAGKIVPLHTPIQVAAVKATPGWSCRGLDGSPLHARRGCCFGVRLVGVPNPGKGRFYNGCAFRPLPRSQHIETLLEKLRQPKSVRERKTTRAPVSTA